MGQDLKGSLLFGAWILDEEHRRQITDNLNIYPEDVAIC
jgi:hypothetical protein